MIMRNASWPNVYPLYDAAIEKSATFSIGQPAVQIVFQGAGKIKFGAGQMNAVVFTVAMIPNDINPHEITKIADLKN